MNKKTKLAGSAVVLAAAVLLASSASAVTLVETGTLSPQPTNFLKAAGDPGVISIGEFNPKLGKLESIDIYFTAVDDATASATNNNPLPKKGKTGESVKATADLTSDINLFGANGAKGDYVFGTLDPSTSVKETIAAGGSSDFGGTISSSLTTEYVLDPKSPSSALFDKFIGKGVYDFLVDATGHSKVTGSGNFTSTISTDAGATITVDYNYAAVPEPATWAVMLVGFGGIGASMRSRRRQAAATA